MKPAIIDGEAAADEAMGWYNQKQPGLGANLHNEVSQAIKKIEADPLVGVRYRKSSVRFFRLKRFPYVIYYMERPATVWLIAIAHARRRPNYWRKRLT